MSEKDRGPDISPPPPVVVAAGLVVAWVLGAVLPVQLGPPTPALGGLMVFASIAWLGWALLVMVRAGNDPRPHTPDTLVVRGGPYRFGRNPIYLGFVGFLAGVALAWGTLWAWLAVGAVFLWLDFAVIRREELYLREKFGAGYAEYAARTRRWL